MTLALLQTMLGGPARPHDVALWLAVGLALFGRGFTWGGRLAVVGAVGFAAAIDALGGGFVLGAVATLLAAGAIVVACQSLCHLKGRRHAPRTAASVAWNLAPGLMAALAINQLVSGYGSVFLMGSMAGVVADTVGGEIGQAWKGRPIWPRRALVGSKGAISLLGLSAGFLAVLALPALLSVLNGFRWATSALPWPVSEVVDIGIPLGIAATLASLVDSWLGARTKVAKGPRNAIVSILAPAFFLVGMWRLAFS
ncbi:MAG: DUF92 domain-containing protein [Chloroflexi bacterium]|nr:DUF92 domain-containing protein [Chloroflexota bacterium]